MKPTIFFNVAWMDHYKGIINDIPRGGGSFVQLHGYGHEMFNFETYNGFKYGYVQPSGHQIAIEKLGAGIKENQVDNIFVVWVAKHPQGGSFVVGWYDNATVFRSWQPLPKEANRNFNDQKVGYFVCAKQEDCELLPVDQRVIRVPRGTRGGMGQSNVWYADGPIGLSFKHEVANFKTSKKIINLAKNHDSTARQSDLFRKQKIEKRAISLTIQYYENLGYTVNSVEKDNVGWDLEARQERKFLRLEVKGLSGNALSIEMTPNEFRMLNEHRDNYRICVVTNALGENPTRSIFAYSFERDAWQDDEERQLNINQIISARMFLS
jgi:hypothetical protein